MEETIPVIDVEKINCEEGECKKLREACERWGCFRIINHSIPATLMADMKKVIEALLDLPMEIKKRNTEFIAGSGYMAPSKVNPFYEALGLYDLGSSQAMHNFCSQLDASHHQRFVSLPLCLDLSHLLFWIYLVVMLDLINMIKKNNS